MTDLERAARAMHRYVEGSHSSGGSATWRIHDSALNNQIVSMHASRDERDQRLAEMNVGAAIEAILIDPSEEAVEAALDAFPHTTDWREGNEYEQRCNKSDMRAALRAAGMKMLWRQP